MTDPTAELIVIREQLVIAQNRIAAVTAELKIQDDANDILTRQVDEMRARLTAATAVAQCYDAMQRGEVYDEQQDARIAELEARIKYSADWLVKYGVFKEDSPFIHSLRATLAPTEVPQKGDDHE